MFGLRITTKRELALLSGTIMDLRKEVERVREERDHERARAEGAINALMIKCTKMAITPDPLTLEEQEKLLEKQWNIFADGQAEEDAKKLEELQS